MNRRCPIAQRCARASGTATIGDTVALTGTGLDGLYRVSAERLAWAGDSAAAATAGLEAVVILQTCFWVDDGSERLLALVPA